MVRGKQLTVISGFCHIPDHLKFTDARGEFISAMKNGDWEPFQWREMNISTSQKGVIRGMHFMRTNPQAKLIRVLSGRIFDVCLDLRKNSPTFRKWEAISLNQDDGWLHLPAGVAHGFQSLEQDTKILYVCDRPYDSQDAEEINPFTCGIPWPLGNDGVIAPKDLEAQSLMEFLTHQGLC